MSRRQQLIQHYLNEVARFGGPTVSLLMFHEEAAALSWSHKVAALPRLAEQKQETHILKVLQYLRQIPLSTR